MSYFSMKIPRTTSTTDPKIPMRIRMFISWDRPESVKKNIETEFNVLEIPGYNEKFVLTSGEDYTHAIIINTYMPYLNPAVPKKNIVGLAWEPNPLLRIEPQFVMYCVQHMNRYLLGSKVNLPRPFEEQYAFLNHNPMQENIPVKRNKCSIIFSNKGFMEGHTYRRVIIEAILKTDLPIDIWGRGCSTMRISDPRIKGEFQQNSVIPYESYDFHICIENIQLDHYFSEKIVNALLSECTPIYLGSPKIESYFPEQVILLTGIVKKDMDIIRACIENPEMYKKEINREVVNKITNPFYNLDKLFE
jgi:hypothetical protein